MKTKQDRKWLEALTLELRIHNIPGVKIGDTLATVKEHLADSGESAQVAFGSPAEYATHIAASTTTQNVSLKGTITRSAVGLIAFLAFTQATVPWVAGEALRLGVAQVAWLALPVVAALSVPLLFDKLLRNFWILAALIGTAVSGGVLAAFSAPRTSAEAWLSVAPLPVLLITASIMVIVSFIDTIATAKDGDDSIIDPLRSQRNAQKTRAFSVASNILVSWIFPIAALALLVLSALLGR
ncbi:hypothetical protein CQ018_15860 [Arthrobacter sp. MYb227]|nr:hypothetical protein CQ018_15860 [Arthrobacter sp. MYb227]